MKLASKTLAGVLAATSLVVAAPLVATDNDRRSDDLKIIGLTDDSRIVQFEDDRPERTRTIGKISGLTTDTKVVGIDYRPADGSLYAVGERGGIYTLDSRARATLVSRMDVALTGASFGVDFNPAVDRLRVVSDTGQNLRINVDTGATLVDGPLTNPGPPAATALGVTGSAYTNNDADPTTATTLFGINTTTDQVVIQAPANAGLLSPTGGLGVDTGAAVGFDIYSTVRNGSTVDLEPYASLTVGGRTGLYEIDLLTGRADREGNFPKDKVVTDIAIPLNQR